MVCITFIGRFVDDMESIYKAEAMTNLPPNKHIPTNTNQADPQEWIEVKHMPHRRVKINIYKAPEKLGHINEQQVCLTCR